NSLPKRSHTPAKCIILWGGQVSGCRYVFCKVRIFDVTCKIIYNIIIFFTMTSLFRTQISSIGRLCHRYIVTEEKKVVRVTKDGSTATYKETEVRGSTHIMTNDNEELKVKALRAGDAVTDLVDS